MVLGENIAVSFLPFSPHIAENPGFQQYERYGQQYVEDIGQYENDIGWEGAIREFSLFKIRILTSSIGRVAVDSIPYSCKFSTFK